MLSIVELPNNIAISLWTISQEIKVNKLYKEIKEKKKEKPRTYREEGRKDYLTVAKKRRPSKKEKRKGIKKQLQYIKRNLLYVKKC